MSVLATTTVEVGHCALVYRDGQLDRILSPGSYRLFGRVTVRTVDLRERVMVLAPQEVLTADAISLRVTVALRFAVADAQAFIETSTDPVSTVYLAAQIALRDAVAAVNAEEVLRRGDRIDGAVIGSAAQAAGARVGIDVREAVVRDVIAPQEIRSAALELVTARARGAAKLEAARAETAALRALANAGRLLEAHPALATLKLVQSVPYGSQIKLSVGAESGPATD